MSLHLNPPLSQRDGQKLHVLGVARISTEHQPGGASQGNFDARPTVSLTDANLVNGLLVRNGEDAANRWAVPHDPQHSMVLMRITGEGLPRMPPLATHELDPGAINLLSRWINNLPADGH